MNEKICPVCDSKDIELFFEKCNVSVHQNLIFEKQKDALAINRGDIKLGICKNCGYIYNYNFEPDKLSYGINYDNNQANSDFYKKYINDEIEYLVNEVDIRNKVILEIGCGQGDFLKELVSKGNNIGYGFDPSFVGEEKQLNGKVTLKKSFYNGENIGVNPDVIIMRHVLEHIPNLTDVLNGIKSSLKNSNEPKIFIECPNAEWIFKNKVFWNIFYEYCSYFFDTSLNNILNTIGFETEKINYTFGGQYMWILAKKIESKHKKVSKVETICLEYAKSENNMICSIKNRVTEIKKRGKLAIWGAAGRGTTFANIIDPKNENIECIIDINKNKQNKFVGGSGHPIISYKDIRSFDIKSIIVMNKNYYDEIKQTLEEEGLENIELIDLDELI